MQTDKSNASYSKASLTTVNLIGQFGFCFSVIGKQPKTSCSCAHVFKCIRVILMIFM